MKLYHCTDAGDEVEHEGFWDSMYSGERSGVFLRAEPTLAGMFAIEVEVPDDVAAYYRESSADSEWCVPAALLNVLPRRRVDL
jgi:hypothetical protein